MLPESLTSHRVERTGESVPLSGRQPFAFPIVKPNIVGFLHPAENPMTKLKLLLRGLIAATLLPTPVVARENRPYARHHAEATDAGATPAARYIDGHLCYPALRVGAFATQPWDNSPPCEPTPAY
jgi:hypothetical protein